MKRFIAIWIVLSATLNIWQCVHIKSLEKSARLSSIKLITKAPRYSVRSLKKGDMASYTRLPFVITVFS